MKEKRADYSELVEAIRGGDHETVQKLLDEILPRLTEYLVAALDADIHLAEDTVQQAFADVYEKIQANLIKEPRYIFRYLVTTCRNEYLKIKKRENFLKIDEHGLDGLSVSGGQISNLLDKERQRILKECLSELPYRQRVFIEFFFANPEISSEEAEKEFGLSRANVRTRKSRILNRLHQCYKRKSGN